MAKVEPNKLNEHILLPILLLIANETIIVAFYALNEYFKLTGNYYEGVAVSLPDASLQETFLTDGLLYLSIGLLSLIPSIIWKKSWILLPAIAGNLVALIAFWA